MVSLRGISSEHVRMAAAEIDRVGVPIKQRPIAWYVVVDGKYYPPKYIVCLAHNDTRTGKAQDHLISLGFGIVQK